MGLFNRGLTGQLFNQDVVIALYQAFSTLIRRWEHSGGNG